MTVYTEFLKVLENSFRKFLSLKTLIIIALDILFLYLYFLIMSIFSDKIIEASAKLSVPLLKNVSSGGAILKELFSPQVIPYTTKLVYLVFGASILTYLIYCLIQGIVWSLVLKEKSLKKYLIFFFKTNFIFLAAYYLISFLDTIFSIRSAIVSRLNEQASILPFIILKILTFLLVCYIIIIYIVKNFSKTNKLIKNDYLSIIIMFCFIILVLLSVNFIDLSFINKTLGTVVSILLFFSSLVFLRYFMVEFSSLMNK